MNCTLIVVLVLLLAGGCSDERGGWREAKWGMSPKEAVEALKSDAELVTSDTNLSFDGNTFFIDPDIKAVQRRYEVNGRDFVVLLQFGNEGLTHVHLHPYKSVPENFAIEIKHGLTARWGQPLSENKDECKPRGILDIKSMKQEDRWDSASTSVALSQWSLCDPSSVFMSIRYGRGSGALAKRL